MSVLSRLFTATAGNFIKASEVNAEFDQIINLVSGVSTDKEAYFNSAAPGAGNPVLKVNRGDAGDVAQFKVGGSLIANVTTTPTATTDLTQKSYVDGKKTYWIHTVFDSSPSDTTGDATPFAMWHVPNAAANFFVDRVSISYADSVAGDNDASFTFKLRKSTGGAAASDLATVVISKTLNPTSHTAYGTLVTGNPVSLATNDTLFFIWSTHSAGTFRLRKITLAIHGYSTPV